MSLEEQISYESRVYTLVEKFRAMSQQSIREKDQPEWIKKKASELSNKIFDEVYIEVISFKGPATDDMLAGYILGYVNGATR